MRKAIVLTVIGGAIGFGVLSCSNTEPSQEITTEPRQEIITKPRQEIIFVTESVNWKKYSYDTSASPYGDNTRGEFDRRIDAVWSSCSEYGPSKEEFREKVKSGEFRVISSQKSMQGVMYTARDWLNGGRGNLEAQCHGIEYVVEY